ncbi:DUF4907 domain-containing protein [Bacteroides faecium]|nr:DUF4907 domain-containing protein [Bacteroides faecium]
MKKNKIITGIGCLILLLTAGFVCYRNMTPADRYHLEVMKLGEDGYGYKIYEGERTIIVQPFIPAVAGKRAFRAEQDARRVGNLVLERIEAGDEFTISKGDLEYLGIVY